MSTRIRLTVQLEESPPTPGVFGGQLGEQLAALGPITLPRARVLVFTEAGFESNMSPEDIRALVAYLREGFEGVLATLDAGDARAAAGLDHANVIVLPRPVKP